MTYTYPLVFLSGSLLGISGFIEKYYIFNKLTPYQLIFYRNTIIFLMFLIYSYLYSFYSNKNILSVKNYDKNIILIVLIYTIIYSFVIYNIFNGFKKKPAYKVSFLIQISILISAFLYGFFIAKEKFNKYNILGIILSLISIVLLLC
tara:strand:+ start:76 stop:516 length:441 start_codon:yes stop_codon:yes gene_type:complete